MGVENVVWPWISMRVDDDMVIHYGMGRVVGSSMGVFYMCDVPIGSQKLEWIQGDINVLIGLFCRIGLMAKFSNSRMMTCHPGTIRLWMSEKAVGWRITGRGVIYQERPWQ